MNRRRQFLIALGAGAVAASRPALAQPKTPSIPHVGYLSLGSMASNGAFLDAFKDALRELGYVEGRNIAIDVTWAGKAAYEFPNLAATLVKTNPAAIVTTCVPSTKAAKSATHSIPVVMSVDGDPVASGLVASLARPGANITGTSTLFEELIPKHLEFLKLAVPKVRNIAVLVNPEGLTTPYFLNKFGDAARQIGIKLVSAEARVPADFEPAFAHMKKQHADAFVVLTEAFMAAQLQRIVTLANVYKLPGIYGFREFAEAGGLMSYGLSYRDYYKGVAQYVDKVLKGAKPADLPVEQPTKIEFVINQSTARALGINLPAQLLVRADRVIK
jgi:putative tryptophan/tyrosine transport system substrate-binding protein